MVESSAAAFESCLPSIEMRPSTAAESLVPTGEASKASETTSNQPPLRLCLTGETDLKVKKSWTSVLSASYDSSSVFQERNLSATRYCRKAVDTKSGQNRTSDPGGSRGRGRLPVFGIVARVGLWRGFNGLEQLETSCSVFSVEIRWLFVTRPVLMLRQEKVLPSRAVRGYMSWRQERRPRRR